MSTKTVTVVLSTMGCPKTGMPAGIEIGQFQTTTNNNGSQSTSNWPEGFPSKRTGRQVIDNCIIFAAMAGVDRSIFEAWRPILEACGLPEQSQHDSVFDAYARQTHFTHMEHVFASPAA